MISFDNHLFSTKLPHRFECGMIDSLEAGGGGQFGGDPGPSGGIGDPTGFGRSGGGGGTSRGFAGLTPGSLGGLFDLGIAGPQSNIAAHEAEKLSMTAKVAGVAAGLLAGLVTGNIGMSTAIGKLTAAGVNKFTADRIAGAVSSGQISASEGASIASGGRGESQAGIQLAQFTSAPGDPETAAQQAITAQEAQFGRISELTAPFREAATGTALPALSSLAMGGEIDFQPSALFQQQLGAGRQGILRQQAGRGSLKSSGTFGRLADLVGGLAGEDVGRFEQGQLGLLRSGLQAEDTLRQAGTALTGATSGTLSNLGQQLNLAQQAQAQKELSRGQTLASGVTGLGALAGTLF